MDLRFAWQDNPGLLLTVLNPTPLDSLVNTLNPTLQLSDSGGGGERKEQKKGRMKTRTEETGRNGEGRMEKGRVDRKREGREEEK